MHHYSYFNIFEISKLSKKKGERKKRNRKLKPNQKYQFSLIIFKSWKYLTLSLCEINYLVRICVYTYILISYTRSYRRDTIFSTDGKNRWYFNWTVNGWRFFDIYVGWDISHWWQFVLRSDVCLLIGIALEIFFVIAR